MGKKINPLLYFYLTEAATYTIQSITLAYTLTFQAKDLLQFVNKVRKYSELYTMGSNKLSVQISKLFPSIMFSLTCVGLLNDLIFYNFGPSMNELYSDAQYTFLWREVNATYPKPESETIKKSNVPKLLFVLLRQVAVMVSDLKDMYLGLFLLSGILPLWLISLDFKTSLLQAEKTNMNETDPGKKRSPDTHNSRVNRIFQRYRCICQISRLYSKAYGDVLFCFFFNYLMYYSTSIDKLIKSATAGKRIYELEFISTFAVVYILGAHFSYQVYRDLFTWSNIWLSNKFYFLKFSDDLVQRSDKFGNDWFG